MATQQQKSNKNKKYGRTDRSPSMKRYNMENRAERNRVARLKRHVASNPDDGAALKALSYQKMFGRYLANYK